MINTFLLKCPFRPEATVIASYNRKKGGQPKIPISIYSSLLANKLGLKERT